jgi:hypothetical protein
MLAGCGGSQPPIGAPGAMPQTTARSARAERGTSWMLPNAKNTDLLYATSGRTVVSVFTYPKMKLVGTLSGFEGANGACVGNAGDTFITNGDGSSILEFAHGGTAPINTLNDPGYTPFDCAIDPISGDLAVANFDGGVAIYKSAQGAPIMYSLMGVGAQFCGYDNEGNLFVDGYARYRAVALLELQRGSNQFENITVDFNHSTTIGAGPIQWDGQHLAMGYGEYNRSVIYQLSVSGSNATIVGSTTLEGPKLRIGIGWWIQDGEVLAPNAHHGDRGYSNIGFWHYPEGGKDERMFHFKGAEDDFIQNLAVSLAPH